MKKQVVFGTLLAVLVLMVVTLGVSASTNVDVGGTYEFYYDEPTVVMPLGHFCYIEARGRYPFSGDLEGEAVFDFQVISHGSCETALPFANKEDLRGHGTFTGKVLGEAGTLDMDYRGRGWPVEVGSVQFGRKSPFSPVRMHWKA